MIDKTHLNNLISYQEEWINQLNETKNNLIKYRDGILPFSESQISNISIAQQELSKAIKNMAEAVRAEAKS